MYFLFRPMILYHQGASRFRKAGFFPMHRLVSSHWLVFSSKTKKTQLSSNWSVGKIPAASTNHDSTFKHMFKHNTKKPWVSYPWDPRLKHHNVDVTLRRFAAWTRDMPAHKSQKVRPPNSLQIPEWRKSFFCGRKND